MRIATVVLVLLIMSFPAFAQLQPQGADVNLYFPQIADGGTGGGKWQTTFAFVNPTEAWNKIAASFPAGSY
jgi:hypothetical protein